MVYGAGINGISAEDIGQAMTEGALLGTYTFRQHITRPPDYKEIRQFNLLEPDDNSPWSSGLASLDA